MTVIDQMLQQFELFGIKLGLESSQALLKKLGDPHHRVPMIHVAGSNGKGSVCAYLSAGLTAAGYRVGRYTSPHLINWEERICLNEQPIATSDLEQILQQVITAISPAAPSPSQFEVITAAAWLFFAQQQVDVAVMEVGLGGRLDATNVCDRPLACVITTISREHWQILGSTLAEIAAEKAGILKSGCPAVIGQLPAEAMAVVNQRIQALGCLAIYPMPAIALGDGWAEWQGIRYQLPLLGAMQLHNSAVAIATLKQLQQQGWNLPDEVIAAGIAKTQWNGRMQWFTWQNQQLLIDGAHNPAGAIVLRQFVDELGQRRQATGDESLAKPPYTSHLTPHTSSVTWVMGMMAKKDHQAVFEALLRSGDRLLLVPVPDGSTADPKQLAQLALAVCPELAACEVFVDVFAALETAFAANSGRSRVVLCGSLYLIGHFLAEVQASRGF